MLLGLAAVVCRLIPGSLDTRSYVTGAEMGRTRGQVVRFSRGSIAARRDELGEAG